MISRKEFIKKTCIGSACFCGFAALIHPVKAEGTNTIIPERNLSQNWLNVLLNKIDEIKDENFKKQAVKSCAVSHYNNLNMNDVLQPYVGEIEKFITFLSTEWGWVIEYDKNKQQIIANENKKVCVCPVLPPDKNKTNPLICYCSEGFAELMFSKILEKKVSAEVISSIHRGNKNCIYKISI